MVDKYSAEAYVVLLLSLFKVQYFNVCSRRTDGDKFDYIFCMDDSNITNATRVLKSPSAKLLLLGDFDPEKVTEVDDPYYGDEDGFEICYHHVKRCLEEFVKTV